MRRIVRCSAGYSRANTFSAVRAMAPWMPPARSYPSTVRAESVRRCQVASSAWETSGSAPDGVSSAPIPMGPDVFLDGRVFDPDDVVGYLEGFEVTDLRVRTDEIAAMNA